MITNIYDKLRKRLDKELKMFDTSDSMLYFDEISTRISLLDNKEQKKLWKELLKSDKFFHVLKIYIYDEDNLIREIIDQLEWRNPIRWRNKSDIITMKLYPLGEIR